MYTTRVKWIEDQTFLGIDNKENSVVMSSGGGPGVSPFQLLLVSLGGCSMVDIVTILQKQRQELADLEVTVQGERGDEGARPLRRVHMHFVVTGVGLDADKVQRAIDLGLEKYCGVHATLSAAAEITHDFEIREA